MTDELEQVQHELHRARAESAPLAWQKANTYCRTEPSGARPCLAYHRSWQFLRLLGLKPGLSDDLPFFMQTFLDLVRAGDSTNLLISGAEDYGLLACILQANALSAAHNRVTVLDLCDTPLWLNRWYAEQKGAAIETAAANILDHSTQAPFDVIATHAILRWFAPADRLRLLARWHDLLRPGGLVVTTTTIVADAPNRPRRYSAEKAQAYKEQVIRTARAYHGVLGVDPKALGASVYDFTLNYVRYTIESEEALCGLFEDAGFTVAQMDAVPHRGVSIGPNQEARQRIRLIAERS